MMDNKWALAESSNEDREKIWKKNRTFAGDVWYRFSHKPTAIAGLVLILVLLLFAFAGPAFTHYSYSDQNLEVVNIPPVMKVYEKPDQSGYLYINQQLQVLQVEKDGTLGVQLPKVRDDWDNGISVYDCGGTEVAPVGTAFIGCSYRGRTIVHHMLPGPNDNRELNRNRALLTMASVALRMLDGKL